VPETTTDQPVYPPGRYGKRREPRPPRRGRTILVAAVGGLVGLVLALVMFARYHARYQPQVINFRLDDRSATVRFEVTHQGETDLVCHVRSRSRDGVVVGSADVRVPQGHRGPTTHTITTTDTPVSAEVTVCRAAG
jgi:Domain of unknown function (DUF4307)